MRYGISTRTGLTVACLAGLSLPFIAITDAQGQPRYVDSSGVIRNHTTGGTRSGGLYSALADVFDNRAIPTGDIDLKAGRYPAPPFTAATRVASVAGTIYTPSAQAQMNTFARSFLGIALTDGWDSRGSFATLGRNGPTGSNPAEFARASSIIQDPNSYEVMPGDNSVTFSLVFEAGTRLSVMAESLMEQSAASLRGNQDTNLLSPYGGTGTGSLFNFEWSLTSSSPGATSFSFTSNPALGLNDSMIRSAFLSNVSGSNGEFMLVNDFVIEATISAAAGTQYIYGGTTQYEVSASVIPTPGSLALLCAGTFLTLRRRRGGCGDSREAGWHRT